MNQTTGMNEVSGVPTARASGADAASIQAAPGEPPAAPNPHSYSTQYEYCGTPWHKRFQAKTVGLRRRVFVHSGTDRWSGSLQVM
jgi:hypothetical protein